MWTPSRYRPPGVATSVIASSKSRASSPSMVTVGTCRKSVRPSMSGGAHHLSQALRLRDSFGREQLGDAEAPESRWYPRRARPHRPEPPRSAFGAARLAGIPGQVHNHHVAGAAGKGSPLFTSTSVCTRVSKGTTNPRPQPPPPAGPRGAGGGATPPPARALRRPVGAALHARGDAIAVHRVSQLAGRDEQVLEVLPLAGHEPDAARRRVDGAHDEMARPGRPNGCPRWRTSSPASTSARRWRLNDVRSSFGTRSCDRSRAVAGRRTSSRSARRTSSRVHWEPERVPINRSRTICRSPTLVRVGPVRIRSPRRSKKA